MEMSLRIVFGAILLLIVLGLVVYAIVTKGILGGFGNILEVGGEWLGKLFSKP